VLRSRNEVLRGRRALATAREELIEALGDSMCGGGPPPLAVEIEALTKLAESCEKAEMRYALCVAALVDSVAERSRHC
jgi:hypothetical protein